MEVWNDLQDSQRAQLIHDLIVMRKIKIPDVNENQVHTLELEKRMQAVKWKDTVYDFVKGIETIDPKEKELFNAVNRINYDVQRLAIGGPEARAAACFLQIKYWYNTKMHGEIESVPNDCFHWIAKNQKHKALLDERATSIKISSNKMTNSDRVASQIAKSGFSKDAMLLAVEQLKHDQQRFEVLHPFVIDKDFCIATLRFEKDQYERYDLKEFDITIEKGRDGKQLTGHFNFDADLTLTRDQAYHLLKGRAIGFLEYVGVEPVEVWMVYKHPADPSQLGELNIIPLTKSFTLERALGDYEIAEMQNIESKAIFLQSIRSGVLSHATITKQDKTQERVYVTADPLERGVNFYSVSNMEKLNKQQFLYKPPHKAENINISDEEQQQRIKR